MTTTAQPETPLADGRDLLTHSRASCFKACNRRHYYAYELGFRRDRTGDACRIGVCVHDGVDHWFKTVAANPALGVEERIALGVAAAEHATAGYAEYPAWCITFEDQYAWRVEEEIARRIILGYAWRWSEQQLEIVASEQAFDVPLVNPETGAESRTFRQAGKIDNIVRLADHRQAVIEHKPGDNLEPDSDYWKRLRIDQQISSYIVGARALGYDVQTVLYDAYHRPGIRPRKLTQAATRKLMETGEYHAKLEVGEEQFIGDYSVEQEGGLVLVDGEEVEVDRSGRQPAIRESIGMYGDRLAADMSTRPDFYFARMEIPRLQQDLDEFRFELWQQAGLLRDCRRLGRWPRNTDACLRPWKCPYFDLCTNGADLAELEKGNLPAGFVHVSNVNPELEELQIQEGE